MDKSELLAEFKSHLASFERYQGFIDKARGYAERFNPAVVEKVIADNSERIAEVAQQLNPLVPAVRAVLAQLESQRDGIREEVESSRLALEEFELRMAIGEISEGDYESSTSALKGVIGSADDRITEVELELEEFSGTLDRWLSARPEAEDVEADDGGELDDAGEEDLDLGSEADDDGIALDDDGGDDIGFGDDEPMESAPPPPVSGADDVSVVFDSHEDSPIEGDDGGIDFSPNEISDLADDLLASDSRNVVTATSSGSRRAVLVQSEGTSDEQAYPLTNEPITIGRGRDNTVQVKNDSKVSRQHCRVFRRGAEYYVEDNKSANGTSVDGELITEKRLVGGEALIVGETQFRFRIEPG
ncbi:MAG TPA: FHA domain-containing protein [Myxococcota bacterium]|nr:FHA domain-containing protein [Myxococcota bacterium]